jgi:hypothetical protein
LTGIFVFDRGREIEREGERAPPPVFAQEYWLFFSTLINNSTPQSLHKKQKKLPGCKFDLYISPDPVFQKPAAFDPE